MKPQYQITITGTEGRGLLLHHDNIKFGGRVKQWCTDPANKAKSVAGDDRSPAWTWIGCLYHDGKRLTIPSDNLMTVLREGGKRVSTGKRGSFKSQTQSGIILDQFAWPLLINGKEVPWEPIAAMGDNEDFEKHEALATSLGFELFVKRAKPPGGNSKHVRVRPRFLNWSCSGTLTVLDDTIKQATLQTILNEAGRFAGLGDWRPSAPKSPGPFGTFTATVEAL